MNIDELIQELQHVRDAHGDLPIRIVSNGVESEVSNVSLLPSGQAAPSASGAISMTGPHMFEPDRLAIAAGRSIGG